MYGRYFCAMKPLSLICLFACSIVFSCSRPAVQQGVASYYADKFNGRKTASGATFRNGRRTAAHKTLPFGTRVTVTNLKNGRKVKVRINDRGPFVGGRIIDLSKKAARKIGMVRDGVTDVKLSYRPLRQ